MSKSAFIEFILKEQMNTTNQLFNSSDTLFGSFGIFIKTDARY